MSKSQYELCYRMNQTLMRGSTVYVFITEYY